MNALYAVAVALSAWLMAAEAIAQTNYPDKQIRLLVGFAPAGPADIAARVLADRLAEAWGTPVLVENVTGAGGNVAIERVARAAPDGYTLALAASSTIVTNVSLYDKLPFDPIKDFAPISQLVFTPNILAVNNDVPAKTVPELVALAKARPGGLKFGSAGVGRSEDSVDRVRHTVGGLEPKTGR